MLGRRDHSYMGVPPRPPMAGDAARHCVEIEEDADSARPLPVSHDIAASPVDYALKGLYKMMQSREVVLPPDARRRAWDVYDSSRLIESFLLGLPVPPVILLEREDRSLLVVDGRRRLLAVRGFFDGRLEGRQGGRNAQDFELEGVADGMLRGRSFSCMGLDNRLALENAVLRAIVMRQARPGESPAAAHDLVERFSSAAADLGDQEARHRAYPGRLAGLIGELNGYDDWRGLLGSPRRDGRMRDAELILRYMALLRDAGSYERPMRGFLSAFMHRNMDPSDAFIREERARFIRACWILRNRLGALPLNEGGRISPPVFDAVFVTVANNPAACDDPGLPARVRAMLSDPSFAECAEPAEAAADPAAVRRRLSIANGMLCRRRAVRQPVTR